MTADLVAWLTAQLDHDEAHAQKDLWALDRSTPGCWEAHYGHNLPYSVLRGEGGVEIARFSAGTIPLPDGADDLHAADILLVARLVSKARERAEQVLRQVAAHRRILAEHDRAIDRRRAHPDDLASAGALLMTVRVLKLIASIYADREGYDPAWAVQ
jgi:hypothetical protein